MGWLLLGIYAVLGIVFARVCLRWLSEEAPSVPLSGIDIFGAILMFFTWPFSILVLSLLLGKFFPSGDSEKDSDYKWDTRLRKFAGLPPRKD